MTVAPTRKRFMLPIVIFVLLCGGVWFWAQNVETVLGDPTWILGWILTASVILPSFFNLRKRLIAFNFGSASVWLTLHVASGIAAIILFVLHTDGIWPTGIYEQLMATLFAAITLTGLCGLWTQLVLPRRLTETGHEYVYEKIPGTVADLRDAARQAVKTYTEATGSELLSHHYEKSLDWYFARPRFFWNNVFGGNAAWAWANAHMIAIRRFADPLQSATIDSIENLVSTKVVVDQHYACQSVLKRWLLAHVPLSTAFLVVVAWHIVIVHVYAS